MLTLLPLTETEQGRVVGRHAAILLVSLAAECHQALQGNLERPGFVSQDSGPIPTPNFEAEAGAPVGPQKTTSTRKLDTVTFHAANTRLIDETSSASVDSRSFRRHLVDS